MPSRGGTGALIIADVGQGAWEEIDYEPADAAAATTAGEYREGAHPNVTSPPPVYNAADLTDPIWEYSHSVGQSITGGFVYRGSGPSRVPRPLLLRGLRPGARVVNRAHHQPDDR